MKNIMVNYKKLNIGCGNDIRENYVNLDSREIEGVDVVHDVNVLPLPFEESFFDEILCQDVLEHINYIPLMEDMHRILKPGGCLIIRVPHFTSINNFIDPTHKNRFSTKTFTFFVNDVRNPRSYYFGFAYSNLKNIKLVFDKKHYPHRYICELIVNCHPKCINIYENTGLCYVFPSENISLTMIK